MADDALFCVAQKAFVEKDGEVLTLNDPIEGLDFPGGKIQENEPRDGDPSSLTEALAREVVEETGLTVEVGEPFFAWYHVFKDPQHRNYGKKVYILGFRCCYVSGEVRLSHEHDSFKWVNKDNCKAVDDGTDYFDVLQKYFQRYG